MKQIICCILSVLVTISLFAQQPAGQTPTARPSATQTPAQQRANAPAQRTTVQPASQKAAAAEESKRKKDAIIDGYGNVAWGMLLSDAKERVEGKLSYTDEQKIIISKDGELEYHYGFFYIDPAKYNVEPASQPTQLDGGTTNDEGKLFYVSLKFPYLAMNTVQKKLIEKYGESTYEDLVKNSGAIAWEAEKTIIIMWVDQYEKKPFCRRINYISKETTKELNEYMESVFNQKELDVIKKLVP